MPNRPRTRKRNNLTRLNLCFSNPMQPFTPESPPATPTTTSSSADHNRSSKDFNDDHAVALQNPFSNLEPEPEPAELAIAFASQRFFFSSPGRTNSIFESTNTDADCTTSSSSPSTTAAPPPNNLAANKHNPLRGLNHNWSGVEWLNSSVAVETYSSEPQSDFRRSMEEMVEARPELMDVKSNWHLLQELLQCYLALNPKNMHKFILGAFADLLVNLISLSSSPPQSAGAADLAGGEEACSD